MSEFAKGWGVSQICCTIVGGEPEVISTDRYIREEGSKQRQIECYVTIERFLC